MAKYRKKPVIVDATQWWKNGDHPEDFLKGIEGGGETEGKVVRYYRNPDDDGERGCTQCVRNMKAHGWIDTLEGGHIVCPGDFIITGVKGEKYPCKPDIFAETHALVEAEPVAEPAPEPAKDDKVLLARGKAQPDPEALPLDQQTG